MRVEKLELIGFKSFCDRTVFSLHPGITCIVGPNGCGKSNVVDSFKWVLGEQSAKSLRGDKMEEVIFAGTDNKKPRGMSEVSLHISGLGGVKDSTTTVTRRLFRSGDSEYMLNRNQCRLRDIRDIFLDTGLEMKSYSILEQDRISSILAAKPEDRRFLIEEVAGVVKYKVRRTEALSKLESSRANLQRINDITAEVRRQINSLDRQVKRAERFKKLSEEARGIELRVAKRDLVSMGEVLGQTGGRLSALKEEVAAKRAELSEKEAGIESRRIEMAEKEKAADVLGRELQTIEREMAEAERSLAVSRTERENLKEYLVKLRLQEEDNNNRRNWATNRISEIDEAVGRLREETAALTADMEIKEADLKAMEAGIAELEGALEARRRDVFRAQEELSGASNELNRHVISLEALRARQGALEAESRDLASTLQSVEGEARRTEAEMLSANSDLQSKRQSREALAAEIESIEVRIEDLRARTAQAREELASESSRLESMNEMLYSESTGEELRAEVEIIGALSDMMVVEAEYEKAVESALGEAVNGYLVRGHEDLAKAVRTIRQKGLGRTALVAFEAGAAAEPPPVPGGAVGRASDLVSAGEQYRAVMGRLLGGVVVVRDLDSALAASSDGRTVVTLDGEVVSPAGVVTAGRSRGILPLKRRIRELSEEIGKKKNKVEELEGETSAAAGLLASKEAGLKGLAAEEAGIETRLSDLRVEAARHSEEIERSNRKLALMKIEAGELQKETVEVEAVISKREADIAQAEQGRRGIEDSISSVNAELAGKKGAYETLRAEFVEARLSLSSITERQNSLKTEKATVEATLEDVASKQAHIASEVSRTDARIVERQQESLLKEEALKELAVKAEGLEARISGQRERIFDMTEALHEDERGLKSMRVSIDEHSQVISELEVKRAEQAVMADNLKKNVTNLYGVDLEAYEAGPVGAEDEETLAELKRKMESLGPVSLGSIEEYEELKQRYDFLNTQQEDLQKSIAELEEAIKRINSTTRKMLRDAYDALKAKFAEVFVELFGGGRAELVLTDESNILETGIDVVAQPPGKKLQNITLLSGGEKSLTALALLFSSFLIKPTPLCILDEADAALDEANTYKFASMLKSISSGIQFIVVTHNKVTMEAADYIYGVTMEEPGVSRVISLQFAEA